MLQISVGASILPWVKTIISTADAPAAIGPYSQAIAAGGMIYTSGQIPLDPVTGQMVAGGITEQTNRTLDNLEAVLRAAGVSLSNVVLAHVYLTSLDNFAIVNELYGKRFGTTNPPARVTVEVSALPKGSLIEISAIAHA